MHKEVKISPREKRKGDCSPVTAINARDSNSEPVDKEEHVVIG